VTSARAGGTGAVEEKGRGNAFSEKVSEGGEKLGEGRGGNVLSKW